MFIEVYFDPMTLAHGLKVLCIPFLCEIDY